MDTEQGYGSALRGGVKVANGEAVNRRLGRDPETARSAAVVQDRI